MDAAYKKEGDRGQPAPAGRSVSLAVLLEQLAALLEQLAASSEQLGAQQRKGHGAQFQKPLMECSEIKGFSLLFPTRVP